MSSQVQFVLDAEEASAVQAFLKVVDAQKQTERQTDKVTKANRELERAAKKVYESTRTPLEQHKQKMAELNRLVEAGAIDQNTYRRAVDRSNRELRETQRAGRDAFGGQAVSQLKGFVAGWVSVTAAISAARAAFQEYRQLQDESAQRDRASRRGLASLAQLAESPEQFAVLTSAAREMFRQGGAASLDEAGRTIFTLKSAGLFDERQIFTEMMSAALIDTPDAFAAAVAQLTNAMGSSETGTARDVINKAIGASGGALANVPQLLAGAARAGTGASVLGISDEEVLAAVTALSGSTGSAEIAGTQLAALLKSLDQIGGFEGKGLIGSVESIAAKELSGEDLYKLLGRAEAVNAFRLLSGGDSRALYTTALGDIDRALTTDTVASRLRLAGTDEALAAARSADLGQAARELAEQQTAAVFTNLFDALSERALAAQVAGDEQGPALRFIAGRGQAAARFFGGDRTLLESAFGASLRPDENIGITSTADILRQDPAIQRQVATALGPEFVAKLDAAAARMSEAAGKLERATDNMARRPATTFTNQGE